MDRKIDNSLSLEKYLDLVIYEEHHFLEAHQKRVDFYSSIVTAILAATILGAMKAEHAYHYLLLMTSPVLVFSISLIAKDGTFRIYQRFLETVSIRAKVEQATGLTLPMVELDGKHEYWHGETFIPKRHIKARGIAKSSEEFVNNNRKAGYYRASCKLFTMYQAIAVFMFAVLLYQAIS